MLIVEVDSNTTVGNSANKEDQKSSDKRTRCSLKDLGYQIVRSNQESTKGSIKYPTLICRDIRERMIEGL